MGILSWIIFGLIAGILAKWIMPGKDGGGFFMTILLGIVGAVVDMVIAISVGIVLASLLFMRRIARMTRLAPVVVDVPDDVLVLRVIGPLFFAAAEGLFTDLESRLEGKRIVILKWDAVPVLDAGGLDAFQRFVKRLPEGCELRVCNVEFQPLRTMARAGIQPIPGRLAFFPNRRAAMADL